MTKWAPGVRKVWGTCKKESVNEIAKEVGKTVGKFSSNFLVARHVDQQNGKKVWWFTVKAPEKKLLELDKKNGTTSTGDGRGCEEEEMIL